MQAASTWLALCPVRGWEGDALEAVGACLEEPDLAALLGRAAADAIYPRAAIERLREVGLAALWVEGDGAGGATAYHLSALNALTAARSGGLAISLGVCSLALLPVYVAGTPAQRAHVFGAIEGGATLALLLTEWTHGSDLLRIETRATPQAPDGHGRFVPSEPSAATRFRIDGEKDLINGGREADLLVTLTRSGDPSGDPDSPFGAQPPFTLLLVRRDGTISGLPRYQTLPAPASDISGVRFDGTVVPCDAVLGRVGQGFALIQQVLTLSRGGIASLAAGAAHRAWELTLAHANERRLYGAPILSLDPIADHVMRVGALNLIVSALACKATAMMNAHGQAAGYYTAVAKLACCALAEEAVDEGRRVLGARALLHELPYAWLVRDVTLYGVFDGTSHVMMGHVQSHLSRMRTTPEGETLGVVREAYGASPRQVREVASRRRLPLVLDLRSHTRALAALPGTLDHAPLVWLADASLSLIELARGSGVWTADAGVAFALAEHVAHLEALVALVELADPDRRAGLGIAPVGNGLLALERQVAFATCWFGVRLAARLPALAALAGAPVPEGAEGARAWVEGLPAARRALREALRS